MDSISAELTQQRDGHKVPGPDMNMEQVACTGVSTDRSLVTVGRSGGAVASKSSAAGSSGEATHPQGRGLVYGRANPSAFGAGLDFDPVVSSAVPSTSAPTGGSGVVAAGPLVVDGKRVTSPEDEGNAVAGQATSTAAAPGAPRTAGSSGSERARSGVMLGGDVTVGNGDRVGVLSSQLHDVQPDSHQVFDPRVTAAEESSDVWMNQTAGKAASGPRNGGLKAGPGGETRAGDQPVRVSQNTETIEAATAKLCLDDRIPEGGSDNRGGEVDGPREERCQDGEAKEERDREPQPKFGLKVLVPGITAGCLIGKGGRIITQLQNNTSTRVKLSQKNEFFPGTHDRVALVQGEQPARVAEAVTEMLRRLREAARQHPHAQPQAGVLPYAGPDGYGGGVPNGGDNRGQVTVRLLVPLAAGGLIIGKGGETIKAIGAKTGARVILAGKDADVLGIPSERLCSIQSDLEGAIQVVVMIVGKMAEDRGLSKYQSNQTCYQTALGGPAMPPPTLSLPGIIPDPGHLGSAAVVGVGHSATSSNANGTAGAVSPSNGSHAHLNGVGLANTTTGIPGSQQHTHQQPYPPAAAVNMAPTPWAGRPNGRPLSGDLSPFPGTVHGTVPGQPAAGVGTGTGVTNGMGIGTQARMASAVAGGVRAPQDASQSLPHGQPGNRVGGAPEGDQGQTPPNGSPSPGVGTSPPRMVAGGAGGAGSPGNAGGGNGGPVANGVAGNGAGGAAGGVAAGATGGTTGVAATGAALAPAAVGVAPPQQQAHIPGMMAPGMMYGYPYPVSAVPPQRAFETPYASGIPPSVYPYTDMSLMPPPAPHPGTMPELVDGGGDTLAQAQVFVPDHMVGVILGKGGATVLDMQNLTGARIQVSQRGEYVPGTHNRPVTIVGTQHAVASAQMMVLNMCTQAAQYEYRQAQEMHHHHHQQQQPPFY